MLKLRFDRYITCSFRVGIKEPLQLLCYPVLKTEPTAANTRPSKTSGPWVRGKISINIDEIGTGTLETRGILYIF